MKVTKQSLTNRMNNIEEQIVKHNMHPGQDKYELQLDYAACYGGYKMVFVSKENGAHHNFYFSEGRMSASEMDRYQQGIFNTFDALYFAQTNKV